MSNSNITNVNVSHWSETGDSGMSNVEDDMATFHEHRVHNLKLAIVLVGAALGGGCGPSVSMTVQVKDSQGNLLNQITVTNSSAASLQVQTGNTISVTSTASDSDGLQRLWIEGNKSWLQQSGVQNSTILEPPSGNAISPGSSPTQATFTKDFGPFDCGANSFLNLDTGATSQPSSGLFGGGPSTSRTQTAALSVPRGHGK